MKRLIFALTVLAFAHLSLAADYTWVGGASGSWTTLSNWETGGAAATVAPSGGDTAIFTGDVTITGADIPTGEDADKSLLLQIADGKKLRIVASITGAGGVERFGDGTLYLHANNPFTGPFVSHNSTAQSKGRVYIYNQGALGTHSADFRHAEAGTSYYAPLYIDASNTTFTIDVPIVLTSNNGNMSDGLNLANGSFIFTKSVIAPGRFHGSASNVREVRFKEKFTVGDWCDMTGWPLTCHIYYEKGMASVATWLLSSSQSTVHFGSSDNNFHFGTYGMPFMQMVCETADVLQKCTSLKNLGWYAPDGSKDVSSKWNLGGYDQHYPAGLTRGSVMPSKDFGYTSTNAAQVILAGSYGTDLAFNGNFWGKAGLTWNPNDASKVFILSNVVTATKGSFRVPSGVLRLDDGSAFSALAALEIGATGVLELNDDAAGYDFTESLTVDDGGLLKIPAGKTIGCYVCTNDATALTNGIYRAGDADAPFLVGDGVLEVNDAPIFKWIGPAGGNWSADANWDRGVKPTAGARVQLDEGASVRLDEATARLQRLTILNATLTVAEGWSTVKVDADKVVIGANGVLTTPGAFKTAPEEPASRVWISCGDLDIAGGGKIDVDGKGWSGGSSGVPGLLDIAAAGFGPGAALQSDFGSSHGGLGAVNDLSYGFNNKDGKPNRGRFGYVYDDPYAPTLPGSGAASAGVAYSGGGAVRIEATGTVTVDGAIQASSPSYADDSCRGSGGSVWITCATFAGKGSVLANGGSAKYGFYPAFESYYAEGGLYAGAPRAGGGGMIRVECDAIGSLSGMRISAAPGYYLGDKNGIGKLMAVNADKYRIEADLGTLTFNNNLILNALLGKGLSGRLVGVTNYTYSSALDWTWGHVRFAGEGANVVFNGNLTISGEDSRLEIGGIETRVADRLLLVPSRYAGTVLNSCTVNGNLTLAGGAFDIRAAVTNATMTWGGVVSVTGDLTVGANGYLYPWCDPVNLGAPHFVVGGDFTVAETGTVMADRHGGGACGGSGGWTSNTQLGDGQRGWLGDNNRSYGLGTSGSRGAAHGGVGGGAWKWHSGDMTGSQDGAGSKVIVPDEWTAAFPGAGGGAGGYSWGGLGGGLVYVEAQGAVTVNGKITAEGGNGGASSGSNQYSLYCMLGAGAGGGVYLSGASFAGSGWISARGGNGVSSEITGAGAYAGTNVYYTSGCGGGGRIVVRTGADVDRKSKLLKDQSADYQSDPIVQELVTFNGTLTAAGGTNMWYTTGKKTGAPQKLESYGGNGTVRFLRTVASPGLMMIIR